MASSNLNVTVEAISEYQVQEISYEGQEIYVQPLSMSENLTKLAHKIDFNKIDGDETAVQEEEDEKSVSIQQSLWPWDSVRNRLRNALTEVSVLVDTIKIAQNKKYMVLDAVSQEPPETKQVATLIAKKKMLAEASNIIFNGAERLRTSQAEAARARNYHDFYIELLHMRQNWRLKKHGNIILGDLSYKSAGSQFWQTGVFEVHKNETATPILPPPSPGTAPPQRVPPSTLKIVLPTELEGISLVHVTIQKDNESLSSGEMTMPQMAVNFSDLHWQKKLEAAQNVLFCKELFSQLAREAIQLQPSIPNMVVGNQLTVSLFPGVQLCIGLCHSTSSDKVKTEVDSRPKSENKPVLEHSLHQLLRELHYKNSHSPMPHPITAPIGLTKRMRYSGPDGLDRDSLIEMAYQPTLLEQIIKQTQHVVTKMRTSYIIDSFAGEIKDPQLIVHWMCLNSPNSSSMKIHIVTMGYEAIYRTPITIHVNEKSLKAICREGNVVNLSFEPSELRYFLMYQVAQHQINSAQALAKMMGWKVLSSCSAVGVGDVEPIANASSLLISSPTGDRTIAVLSGAHSGIQVRISASPQQQDFYPSSLVRDRKWQNISGTFRDVIWDKMEGRSFLSKMEHLMASLTTC